MTDIQKVLSEIKRKIEIIKDQNSKLEIFNYKMECLLTSLSAYSVRDTGSIRNGIGTGSNVTCDDGSSRNGNNRMDNNTYSTNNTNTNTHTNSTNGTNNTSSTHTHTYANNNTHTYANNNTHTNTNSTNNNTHTNTNTHTNNNIHTNTNNTTKLNDTLNKLCTKYNKVHIIRIMDVLQEYKNGIPWDELIQKINVPKYKCIEILNVMGRTSPPILVKKKDKRFTCYLNM